MTLGQAKSYLAELDRQDAAKQRDTMIAVRAAMGDADGFKSVMDSLDKIIRGQHG